MSESFLTTQISAKVGSGIQRSNQAKTQESQTNISQINTSGKSDYNIGDEFVIRYNRNENIESYQAIQKALNETEYNKLTSSTASKIYEKVSSSITSLFTGNKSSKINQKANEDYAYFNSEEETSEYGDLKYFAQAMGNNHIKSTIKEYEIMKKLLGVTEEEVYENY